MRTWVLSEYKFVKSDRVQSAEAYQGLFWLILFSI